MDTVKLVLCYNGNAYHGYQWQPTGPTIAGELHAALSQLYKQDMTCVSAGRTDAGVHATGQTVSFKAPYSIPEQGLVRGLNTLLPVDIRVQSAETVSEGFHAQHSAISREYRYLFSETAAPLYLDHRIANCGPLPNLGSFDELIPLFMGEHDFSLFKCTGSTESDPVKHVSSFECVSRTHNSLYSHEPFEYYEFKILANSFLYRMVRNIMGILLDYFRAKRSKEDIALFFSSKEKPFAFTTAEAKGLCLSKVNYPSN